MSLLSPTAVNMRSVLCLAAVLTLAGGYVIKDDVVHPSSEDHLDKNTLIRQKDIIRLLDHVNMPLVEVDQLEIAKNFRIENHMYKYTDVDAVEEFLWLYKLGMLPKHKIFSIMYDQHRMEVVTLFNMLYLATDYDTFYKSACWARLHMNEGMFVYALTVAVMHRKDCRGMVLPPPYEIYPNYFINSEVIDKAETIKMQNHIHDMKLANYFGIHKDGNKIIIHSNYSGWYLHTHVESKMTYFTEDIGLNAYHYYFHIDYPFWMGGDKFGLKKDRRGELFYYFHQQLLARYYMERLSNGLGEIPRLSWNLPVTTTFMSSLKYMNGLDMPSRLSVHKIDTPMNLWRLFDVKSCENRIIDTIYLGYVLNENGTMISLKNGDDIDLIGNIIQGNRDCVNPRYFCRLTKMAKSLIGNTDKPIDEYFTNPSVLENYETSMRDPMFWQMWTRVMHLFREFKGLLPKYTRKELTFPGVKVENVVVDKLVTYFDKFDVDITNTIIRNKEELINKKDNLIFFARQNRLNHIPFTVKLDITSEKSIDAVVRIFIGPKFDSMGRLIKLHDNRHNFFELDSFVYTLKSGKNLLMRKSEDFWIMCKDRTMTRDLMKILDNKITTGSGHFRLDMSEAHNGFPGRLMLPRGSRGGQMFQFFIIVSPVHNTKLTHGTGFDRKMSAGVGSGARFMDGRPLGWPLDRKLLDKYFFTPNMFVKDVTIFHRHLHDISMLVTKNWDLDSEKDIRNVNIMKNFNMDHDIHTNMDFNVMKDFGEGTHKEIHDTHIHNGMPLDVKVIKNWDTDKGFDINIKKNWDTDKDVHKGVDLHGITDWNNDKDIHKGIDMNIKKNWGTDKGLNMNIKKNWDTDKDVHKGVDLHGIKDWNTDKDIHKGVDMNIKKDWGTDKGLDINIKKNWDTDKDVNIKKNLGTEKVLDKDVHIDHDIDTKKWDADKGVDKTLDMNADKDMHKDVHLELDKSILKAMERSMNYYKTLMGLFYHHKEVSI